MSQQYTSFIQEIWSHFSGLADTKLTDLTDHNVLWKLSEYIDAGYVNFKEGRKELYRLSILLENYAVKYNAPLLATFETGERYKYVKDRYTEILQKIPKAWVIGNFNNPLLAPQPPKSTEVVSCDGTNISDMWIVVTRGPKGPFGLVAEDMGNDEYQGFFSYSPTVISKVIESINEKLKINIQI
ncbi:MAG: hypothetical protein HKP26_06375 [Nitrosopumilus sp.]|nr:hypothetical protein [Nitrosopumilus sp.]NNL37566.1 hypothetical protein [Nitrosopumilus sp.]NNM03166.1 hypothetical protein [Nitrosopumilus sp.]